MLVGAGADTEARDQSDFRPIHLASEQLCHEALVSLLERGANVNAQTGTIQTHLMLAAAQAGRQGAAEVVDSLLRAGADEAIVGDDGSKAVDVVVLLTEDAEDVEDVEDVLRVRKPTLLPTRHGVAEATWYCAGPIWQRQAGSQEVSRRMSMPMAIGSVRCRKFYGCTRTAYSGRSWVTFEADETNVCMCSRNHAITPTTSAWIPNKHALCSESILPACQVPKLYRFESSGGCV